MNAVSLPSPQDYPGLCRGARSTCQNTNGTGPASSADTVELTQNASLLAKKKICIDPGHGGRDPGAVGPAHYTEKEANLSIALEVKTWLEERGAQVVMTRDKDLSSGELALSTRVAIANSSKADVFISIHNNASANPASGGTETYYDAHGSEASKVLARKVFDRIVEKTGQQPRGCYPANYYVIKYTDMPGVLTESAFMSNPREEEKLRDPAFRKAVAEAIGEGVEEYFTLAKSQQIDTKKPYYPDDGTWDPLPCETYTTAAGRPPARGMNPELQIFGDTNRDGKLSGADVYENQGRKTSMSIISTKEEQ